MPVTKSIFVKLMFFGQLFVAGICTKFHKNPTNTWVANAGSLTHRPDLHVRR